MAKKKKFDGGSKNSRKAFLELPKGFTTINPNETFRFHCSNCGDCCRNAHKGIMLESLDLFRLAKHLKVLGHGNQEIGDVLEEYADPSYLIGAEYFPLFTLKTVGSDDACIFLKDNRCSVQQAKPRACRTYPLCAEPSDIQKSKFDYIIISNKPHHFTGAEIRADEWMDAYFTDEDREFVILDTNAAVELAPFLNKLRQKGVDKNKVLRAFISYKYLMYELDEPFMPQFIRNMAILKKILSDML